VLVSLQQLEPSNTPLGPHFCTRKLFAYWRQVPRYAWLYSLLCPVSGVVIFALVLGAVGIQGPFLPLLWRADTASFQY
jgi:hypothetical protein